MADNTTTQSVTPATLPSGAVIAARAVTYSGDANALIAPSGLVSFAGSDDAKTATDVPLPTALGTNGGLKVDIVGDAGTATTLDTDDGSVAAAQVNIPLVMPLRYTWNGSAWVRGGWTPFKLVSAASTNATSVKGSAGVLGMATVSSVNAAVRYLKFYNKATAPTVGTDTPVLTFAIPGNTAGAGSNVPIPDVGIAFSTGIAFALTVEATDAGSTGVAVSEIVVNLGYL